MKLYLVRHGETDWNIERRLQGQVDIPLNEFGKSLAVKTGKGLENIQFDICFTSPLKRAKETAELILFGKDTLIVDDVRIIEMAFADWEGKHCSKERWEVPDSFQKFFDDPANFEPAPKGESFAQVKARTGEFLQWLYNKKEYEILYANEYDTSKGTFDGTLFVVTNKMTASSGEAAIAHAYSCRNVVFVGSASAGVGLFGDIKSYLLPRSKIYISIPFKVFFEGKEEGKGPSLTFFAILRIIK